MYEESSIVFKFTASLALFLFEIARLKDNWKKSNVLFAASL